MKVTRTFLVVLAAAFAGACSHASSPVAPPDDRASFDTAQPTSNADSVSTELRGVYTLGSGN
jgi:hypothetical protein